MNSWTNLNEALSQLPFINDLTEKKAQLDALRPLSQEVEGRVMQKIRLEWNYHSNAIEGNKLTFGETYSFLMYGLTAKGKPLKDHLDIRGHNEAINFLTSLVKDDRDLTETDIRDLHRMILVEPYQTKAQTPDGQLTSKTILLGEYKKMPNHVKTPTGEIHYYATPDEVPILMGELMTWYSEAQMNKNIHPSVLAAFFHHRFVAIHPFDDGNGRLGRILMNLILMKNGYPPAVIKLKVRTDYYAALNQADKNEFVPLMEFVAEAVSDSVDIYLKAARGESIEEESDIDKEIALFKASFKKIIKGKTDTSMNAILLKGIKPLVDSISLKSKDFNDFFRDNKKNLFYRENDYVNYPKVILSFNNINEFIYASDKLHDSLFFEINWFGFNKNLENNLDFNFNVGLKVNFKDNHKYSVYFYTGNDNELLSEKSYEEIFSEEEIKFISSKWKTLTFENLKKKIN